MHNQKIQQLIGKMVSIGLAKKFIRIFLYDGMEKQTNILAHLIYIYFFPFPRLFQAESDISFNLMSQCCSFLHFMISSNERQFC